MGLFVLTQYRQLRHISLIESTLQLHPAHSSRITAVQAMSDEAALSALAHWRVSAFALLICSLYEVVQLLRPYRCAAGAVKRCSVCEGPQRGVCPQSTSRQCGAGTPQHPQEQPSTLGPRSRPERLIQVQTCTSGLCASCVIMLCIQNPSNTYHAPHYPCCHICAVIDMQERCFTERMWCYVTAQQLWLVQ